MTAASGNPAAPKKRKIDDQQRPSNLEQKQPKKKSPLFNQPQNFYAPPTISSMSREELSEWRKEQRRKRNRESAAASRNKTRAKIEELEGEVNQWKDKYREMENKMRCMERHIEFLTKGGAMSHQMISPQPPMVVSRFDSPPISPPMSPPPSLSQPSSNVVPNAVTSQLLPPPPAYSSHFVTHFHPSFLSDPQDSTLVETQKAVAVAAVMSDDESSRSHLNQIPRQAVKITGATNFDSSVERVEQQQQQPTGLPLCDSLEKNKEMVEVGSVVSSGLVDVDSSVSSGTPDALSVDVTLTAETNQEQNQEMTDVTLNPDNASTLDLDPMLSIDPINDDEDLLDLLVDTLDGEFDVLREQF
mmetsp:Transcript_1374/g.3023  ORF Transcript_1374/g.3023 Transcript_1374/m.3023 type:complete len:358 (-) Transcript_1374:184-1257(-)